MDTSRKLKRRDERKVGVAAPALPTPRVEPVPEAQFDLWRTSQRALRGQYRLALMLAAGGGIAGAVGGAIYGQRLYRATGLVRIASSLPPVLRETDQNRPIANFDGFMQAQRDVMSSREMIQAAMGEEPWKRANLTSTFGGSGFSDVRFAANLKVETKPRSDHLKITFTDPDPAVAAAAVQSIITSYQHDYVQEQDRVEGQRVSELTGRRDGLATELQKLEAEIGPVAQGQDAASLEPLYLAVADRVKKLRSALADAQLAMAGMPDELQRQSSPVKTAAEAAADEVLRVQTVELARLEGQIEDAEGRLGPNHPVMIRLQNSVTTARERVARANQASLASRTERSQGPSALSLAEREANLRRMTTAAEDELKRLSARRSQLVAFDERATALRQNITEIDGRLAALATEASQGSRLSVVTNGEKPLTALLDSRPKFAAAGAMAGGALPLAFLVMSGSVRRRYRYCDDVSEELLKQVPFVAVMPELKSGGVEESAMNIEAARSIHQLRVRLQPPGPTEPRTYLITSTSAGEGKSSMAIATALSFQAAGFRTLLVDCDLSSRQVTRWFGAEASRGAIEALSGQPPALRRTKSGLSVLPAGQGRAQDAFTISPMAVSKLLTGLRDQFDVILIDAEPVITSVASSIVAPIVDGVVLAFARGQEQAQVNRCLKYIEAIDADVSCVVFNKASASDFRDAIREAARLPMTERALLPQAWGCYGPIAGAVMWSLTLAHPDDLTLVPADSQPAQDGKLAA